MHKRQSGLTMLELVIVLNIIGLMTPNNIDFDGSQLDAMGLFYAGDTITAHKQTDIVGTLVNNQFDINQGVPRVYQVPDVVKNLPPGLISGSAKWYLVVAWFKE